MATRLQRALEELHQAMAGRPFVLVFDHTHAATPMTGLSTVVPMGQPTYVSKGMLEEGKEGVDRLAEESGLKETSSTFRKGEPKIDRREREKRTLDLLGLVLDLTPYSGEELYNVVLEWTDAELEDVGDWAGHVHLAASDNDVEVPPKPACIPAEWGGP